MWTPEGATGPRPKVLFGHGGTQHKKVAHIPAFARRLAEHGWAQRGDRRARPRRPGARRRERRPRADAALRPRPRPNELHQRRGAQAALPDGRCRMAGDDRRGRSNSTTSVPGPRATGAFRWARCSACRCWRPNHASSAPCSVSPASRRAGAATGRWRSRSPSRCNSCCRAATNCSRVEDGIALYDAFASEEKTLMVNPGRARRRPAVHVRAQRAVLRAAPHAERVTASSHQASSSSSPTRLLPGQHAHRAEQRQAELAFEPIRRVDATTLEPVAEHGDGGFLAASESARELMARYHVRSQTWRATRPGRPSRARSCDRRHGCRGCPSSSRPATNVRGVARSWSRQRLRVLRGPACTSASSFGARSGNTAHPSCGDHDRDGRVGGCDLACDVRRRRRTRTGCSIGDRPTVSVQSQNATWNAAMWSMKRSCWATGTGLVALGDEPGADVAHQHRQPRCRLGSVQRHRHHRVVDLGGHAVVQAGAPRLVLPVVGVAGATHDPVAVVGQHLQEASAHRRS